MRIENLSFYFFKFSLAALFALSGCGVGLDTSPLAASTPPSSYYEFDSSWTPEWASIAGVWHLDDLAGSTGIVDSSGNNNVGSPSSGVTLGVGGKISKAASFDGVSGNITVGTLGNLGSNLTNGLTISYWFKSTSTAAIGIPVATRNGGNSTALLSCFNCTFVSGYVPGVCRIFLRSNNNTETTGNFTCTQFLDGNWHHWIETYINNAGNVYIDGVEQTLSAYLQATGSFSNFINPVGIGGGTLGVTNFFAGSLDEVAIWNKGLTAAEVQIIYNRQSQSIPYSADLLSMKAPTWGGAH
jgi:hypothetical protein